MRFCAIGEPIIPIPRKPTRMDDPSPANSQHSVESDNTTTTQYMHER